MEQLQPTHQHHVQCLFRSVFFDEHRLLSDGKHRQEKVPSTTCQQGAMMQKAFQDALREMFAFGLPFTVICILVEVSFLALSRYGINPVQYAFVFAVVIGMLIHPFAIVFAFMKPDFGKVCAGNSFGVKALIQKVYNVCWTNTNRIIYGAINIALMFFLVLILNDNFDGEAQQALIIMSLVGLPLIVVFSTAYCLAIRD